jgi:glycerophosphoryl diester phosphodiesterase
VRIDARWCPRRPSGHGAAAGLPTTCTGSTPPPATGGLRPRATRLALPLWIAHRGAGKLAPENTLAAFRLGAAHGYRAFECDVKLSADGVPFLLHDATLERTTSGQGTAGDRPWAELSQLDAGSWHSRAFAGEPLPTLAPGALHAWPTAFALNIEIKPTPGQEAKPPAATVAAWRAAVGRAGRAAAAQFLPARGAAGRTRGRPELPRALLLDSLWPRLVGRGHRPWAAWPWSPTTR